VNRIQAEAADIVQRVMTGCNLDRALADTLRAHPEFTPQQRGALQDLSYGTTRYFSRLAFMRDRLLERAPKDKRLSNLLLVALYQLEFSKSGEYVIVDQAVRAAKRIDARAGGLVNAVLRNFLRQRGALRTAADAEKESRYAYPSWWINEIEAQYGKRAEAILEAGNHHPPMTLRVNRRHLPVEAYRTKLEEAGIAAEKVGPYALKLEQPVAVERLPGFALGWVSVQDAGAQYAAPLLGATNGMRVLDVCAAPGGKAMHLLELADIELHAVDRDVQRLERVRQNLGRGGFEARVLCGDAAEPSSWWDGKPYQRILADVPCSASGVVRRHPDIKWLRRPADVEGFAAEQGRILDAVWKVLEAGGKLLYATCSIFRQENEEVVARFLSRHAEARREPLELSGADGLTGQLLPDDQHDGFFYALLCKTD
jgi:16S rRNA (cytosine967-C5)-methyltransferase